MPASSLCWKSRSWIHSVWMATENKEQRFIGIKVKATRVGQMNARIKNQKKKKTQKSADNSDDCSFVSSYGSKWIKQTTTKTRIVKRIEKWTFWMPFFAILGIFQFDKLYPKRSQRTPPAQSTRTAQLLIHPTKWMRQFASIFPFCVCFFRQMKTKTQTI